MGKNFQFLGIFREWVSIKLYNFGLGSPLGYKPKLCSPKALSFDLHQCFNYLLLLSKQPEI